MTVKKTLLLAGMALVALSLAVPAGGSSTELWWYDHDNSMYPIKAGKKEVSPHGVLTITQGGNQFGPCTYFFSGWVWSEAGGMGEGTISASETEECGTNIAGGACKVLKTTVQNPWTLTLLASKEVKASNIKLEMHLSAACPAPLTRVVTGSVEGQFVDPVTDEKGEWAFPTTVSFNKDTGLTLGGAAATLDGTIKFGTHLTALPEP